MPKQNINIGTENGRNGDPLRTAFSKINQNFDELYNTLGVNNLTELAQDYAAAMFTGGTHSGIAVTYDDANNKLNLTVPALDLSAVSQDIVPDADNTHDLGSPTKQWRHVYTAGGSIYLDNIKLTNVNGKFTATKVINPGEEDEVEDPEDSDATSELKAISELINGEHSFALTEQGTVELNGEPFTGGGGGSGLGAITVPAVPGTTYKGLQVSYGVIHSNSNSSEYNINKIVIHKPVDVNITMDESTVDDTFRVSNLNGSDVIAMFIVYGNENTNKSLATLQAFAEAAIDNVVLSSGVEGDFNTVDEMKSLFASNYATLASAANGLYANFQFLNLNTNFGVSAVTQLQGTGFVFDILSAGGAFTVTPTTAGSGYAPGNKILVGYAEYGASDGRYNIIVTVDTVDGNGGVLTASAEPELPGYIDRDGTFAGLVGANRIGNGFSVYNLNYVMANDTIELSSWGGGNGYYVGDRFKILGTDIYDGNNNPLASPANDLIITVTSIVGGGGINGYTISGTIPRPVGTWPTNSISDGGSDQYDTGNFINTNLATEINYNNGNTVTDGIAFGEGATYSFAYQDSIFALFVTNNSATYVETAGGSGADGSSIGQFGTIYDPGTPEQTFDNAVTHLNIVGSEGADGIRFSDNTVLTSAEGVGRVKLTSPNNRRIEEVYGYKSVSVTSRSREEITGATYTSVNAYELRVKKSTEIDAFISPYYNTATTAVWYISFDNVTFRPATINSDGGDNWMFYYVTANNPTSQVEDAPFYIRRDVGGDPVAWWDSADLPGGSSNFRGAIIKYHAYITDAGSMVGTIHIAKDSGDDNVAHTEVLSGGTDGENAVLWYQDNENQLKYQRIDGESSTAKIQWSATVFYGSEVWD